MTNLIAIKQANPLPDVACRYTEVARRGDKYWGLCPFHRDTNATNFNIYRGREGDWRYRCFACQEGGDVVDFVERIEGCTTKEAIAMLEDGILPEAGSIVPKDLPPDQTAAWEPIIPVPVDAPDYDPAMTFNPSKGAMKNYKRGMRRLDPYYDGDGSLICYVIRLEWDDGVKHCPTITYCKGPDGRELWAARRMAEPYPLQGLDDLAKFPKKHVLFVSGEKCKAAIDEFLPGMFVVVSHLGGDDGMKKTDLSPLRGRKVTYWPDADSSGRKAMRYAYNEIEKNGTG